MIKNILYFIKVTIVIIVLVTFLLFPIFIFLYLTTETEPKYKFNDKIIVNNGFFENCQGNVKDLHWYSSKHQWEYWVRTETGLIFVKESDLTLNDN